MKNIVVRYSSVIHSSNLAYEYYLSGIGKYNYSLSKKGISEASKASNSKLLSDIHTVYTSPESKAMQTAKVISSHKFCKLQSTSLLGNIPHNVELLLGRSVHKDYVITKNDLITMRTNFIVHFYNDMLLESKSSIVKRIDWLQQSCKEEGNKLIITHGLVIKLLHLYNQTGFNCSLERMINLSNVTEPFYAPLKGLYYSSNGVTEVDLKLQS